MFIRAIKYNLEGLQVYAPMKNFQGPAILGWRIPKRGIGR